MFGNIIYAGGSSVKVENTGNKIESSLLSIHVVFESNNYNLIGEIIDITKEYFEIKLVGEIKDNKFILGTVKMPLSSSKIRVINGSEAVLLLGSQDAQNKDSIYIGKSTVYNSFNCSANLDRLFSNHFAILGNTGSGKSNLVSRLLQNLFYRKENVPLKSNFLLFDVYGEYNSAFSLINNTQSCTYKLITTNTSSNESILQIPPFLLDADDLALLLNADNSSQIPIIDKALRLVNLFTADKEKTIKYKNNIIAKALIDILTSGREATQIRDQVIAVLTSFNTETLNMDSQIVQPGYVRTIKQCLNVDNTGKINAIYLVIEFLEKYIDNSLVLEDISSDFYTLHDLYNAFEYALLSEGILKSDRIYDQNNILKVRLDSIINSNYYKYFDYKSKITKEEYVKNLFMDSRGKKAQIVNMNLSYVDERFIKVLTKIFSKLIFTYAFLLESRASFPVQILVEEAHRYVQNDNDINVIGYNIFDRITKEGRKYGVILGLITQRPSELSKTALSQCSNYFILRMYHPDDIGYIKSIMIGINSEIIEKIKTASPGVVLVYGNAFNVPTFVRVDRPNPSPSSDNASLTGLWY